MPHPRCMKIPQRHKDELRFLFLAKHALSSGEPDAEDGNHAVYHYEILQILHRIGLRVVPSNRFESLYGPPGFDFLVTLFNRAGFRNSEMFAPLFGEFHALPYWGASPLVRGLTDDKHFMKRVVQALGITTPPWKYYPMGGLDMTPPAWDWERLIVKPNASSASWGIRVVSGWTPARRQIARLHGEGHDVVVERYIDGIDFAVPIIGSGAPWMLPVIEYRTASGEVRTYEEKRELVPGCTEFAVVSDRALEDRLKSLSLPIVEEIWPFDHGRFEFRVDKATGEPNFIEANLNCNLSSGKAIAQSAASLAISHAELVETILCNSLLRQGLIADVAPGAHARANGKAGYTVVLLAAQRPGGEPLAAAAAGRHKCLIEIQGRPMIAWVLDTLLRAPMVRKVLVSIEHESVLEGIPEIADGVARGCLEVVASRGNLYSSVREALDHGGGNHYPAIVTTADNPLLTVDMLAHFCRAVEKEGADAAIAMARRGVMRARYPDGQRRFYAMRDDAYSNCNLYALTSERAMRSAEIFRGGGQFRKKTTRMLCAFGLMNLVLYKLRAKTLKGFGCRLSRSFGIHLKFVEMPFPEAPIDVDNERTLGVVRTIINAR